MSNRIKFFSRHLIISCLAALIIIIAVFMLWYPSPLAKALGVTQILCLLVVINVIIGPLLTLLVYKEGKKTLKMDLCIIVLLQISALLYGLYVVVDGRPAWIVQNGDRFELVIEKNVVISHLEQVEEVYRQPSWFKPQIVAVKTPQTVEEHNQFLVSAEYYPERYTDLNKEKVRIKQYARTLPELQQYNDLSRTEAILKRYPAAHTWMPLRAGDMGLDMVVLLDEHLGVVKIVDLRPWE